MPYIDVPDANVKKMSYYRTFLNRYNYVDANIPGNDYQFPVSIEGVLGYNNAIQLTQPMHLQDLKYFRDPLYSYGNWVSSGETSKCTAFTSNPGIVNWGNTYEQYIAREAWNAYKVHGGDRRILAQLRPLRRVRHQGPAGQVRPGNNNSLDRVRQRRADRQRRRRRGAAVLHQRDPQDRTETAFWYSGARAAAEAYALLGDDGQGGRDERDRGQHPHRDPDPPVGRRRRPTRCRTPTPATRAAGQAGRQRRAASTAPTPTNATMPAGIVAALNDFTVATWVNLAATTQWSRVFDFGSGTTPTCS